MKLNIVNSRKIWFSLSGIMIALSVLAIALFGLRFGIDFTGGSLLEVSISDSVSAEGVKSVLQSAGFDGVSAQSSGDNGYIIRTKSLSESEHQRLLDALYATYGEVVELRFDSIGPAIGSELKRTAIIGVVLTLILIGLYIAWMYRGVSKPVAAWKYGVLTVFTAFHDVIVPVGVFAVLGSVMGWEIGSTFVAAVLTILGYSINDTVVVFDRTRENLLRGVGGSFEETVEISIKETLVRSINTSVTTLLALFAVFFFGGDTTKPFALALIIGIAVGTYSSIFIASPALVTWEKVGKRGG